MKPHDMLAQDLLDLNLPEAKDDRVWIALRAADARQSGEAVDLTVPVPALPCPSCSSLTARPPRVGRPCGCAVMAARSSGCPWARFRTTRPNPMLQMHPDLKTRPLDRQPGGGRRGFYRARRGCSCSPDRSSDTAAPGLEQPDRAGAGRVDPRFLSGRENGSALDGLRHLHPGPSRVDRAGLCHAKRCDRPLCFCPLRRAGREICRHRRAFHAPQLVGPRSGWKPDALGVNSAGPTKCAVLPVQPRLMAYWS